MFSADRMMQTFFPTLAEVISKPVDFFKKMPRTAYYKDSLLYILIIFVLESVVAIPYSKFSLMFLLPAYAIAMLVWLWVWASLMGAFARSLGSWLTTVNAFQIAAYAATPWILAPWPWLTIPTMLWFVALNWLGLVHLGKLSASKAAIVAGILGIVLALPTGWAEMQIFHLMPKLPALLGGQPHGA
ncbi:MAG: hypothetical protein D6771_01350 [Zetaproteobacteria bacterium]|nr:MAG: hypothetical protein D6771_01350 [Zetaproteobacteria bacterium]